MNPEKTSKTRTRLMIKGNGRDSEKRRCLLAAAAFTFLLTAAGFGAGRSGFPVAKIFVDPRALALGGAPISETGWSGGAFLNPAAAAGAARVAQASLARHTLDLWSGSIGASHPLGSNMTAGFSLSRFDYGEFDYIEEGVGNTGETFSGGENLLAGYIAGKVNPQLAWGVAGKYFWGSLENETASATALDAGLTWDPGWESLKVGAAVRNFGSEYTAYGAADAELPTEAALGGSKKLQHLPLTIHAAAVLTASGDGDWTADWLPNKPGLSFGAGGEFQVQPDGVKEPFFLRLGYSSRGQGRAVGHRLDLLSGFAFGLGVKISAVGFDYTWAPMGALGDVHRFGLKGWW